MTALSLAIPCRTDEPGVTATLTRAWDAWPAGARAATRILVCVNGAGAAPVEAELIAWATAQRMLVDATDVDAVSPAARLPGLHVLRTRTAGKARAWNHLRRALETPEVVFMDADVGFAPATIGQLLDTLGAQPHATLVSARTQAAPRPRPFESLQAVPYRLPFQNLSPQLYAARVAGLPPAMPDDLLEPERWLELVVGRARLVHAPGAEVLVRLPDSVRDFFRQRVRIELAKVQIAAQYPGLGSRGGAVPGASEALRRLSPVDTLRLVAYLTLRTTAHAAARWRWARGRVQIAWQQAASTKEWD